MVTAIPVILLGLAGWALSREFEHLTRAEVIAALARWSPGQLLLAAAASAASFVVVAGVELLGLRWLRSEIAPGAVLKVSLIANGLAHTLGAALLVGAAIRARLYARRGVDLATVAAATLYQSASFGLGLGALMGVALVSQAEGRTRLLGCLLLVGVAGYALACAVVRALLHFGSRRIRLPTFAHAIGQILLGLLDNALAVAVLWALLPDPAPSFFAFVDAYVLAYVGGAASGVPGGVGVFEAAVTRLSPDMARAGLAAALLGFRLLFYVAPLIVAAVLLLIELLEERTARRLG